MIANGYLKPLPPIGNGLFYEIGTGTLQNTKFEPQRAFVAAAVLPALTRLVDLVRRDYGRLGWQLRINSALRMQDPNPNARRVFFHSMARALDIQIVDASGNRVKDSGGTNNRSFSAELCNLAVEAGFQWVWNENLAHAHASVSTGGPDITVDEVGAGVHSPTARTYTWQVDLTVKDDEGVSELYAHVTKPGAKVDWTGTLPSTVTTPVLDLSVPPLPLPASRPVTITVVAPESEVVNGQATLHLWARDSFGSVKIDPAVPGVQYPITETHELIGGRWRVLGPGYAHAASADGSVVVGYTGSRAFRWTRSGGMVSLGVLNGDVWSRAFGVSDDGSVVVGWSQSIVPVNKRSFLWTTQNRVMVYLVGLSGYPSTHAYAISGDGSMVVGSVQDALLWPYTNSAFLWTSSGMQHLGFLPGDNESVAYGVTPATPIGVVVVGESSNSLTPYRHAFAWVSSTRQMRNLGVLAGDIASTAYGVSADGSTAVGASYSAGLPSRAVRWTSSNGWVSSSLGSLPWGGFSLARGVSADGSVIVGWADNAARVGFAAFRWTPTEGMINLGGPPGASSAIAYGVSADGFTVVGRAYVPGVGDRAVSWTLGK